MSTGSTSYRHKASSAAVSGDHSLGGSKIGQESNTEGNFTMTAGPINMVSGSSVSYTVPSYAVAYFVSNLFQLKRAPRRATGISMRRYRKGEQAR
ncbi:uncharacterized protein EAF01_003403 [Botrytis porri]|uniref:Uncharacterized protein n=1 Tax=Botrytis porri TaxID=87229 RepID=A0A4Z1L3M7_9HELO|nr:uncharacterized protein EAF01_003403 [Botrytis porri]KAF7909685.1 hypothetical protein EAF01_003403 [Botrytis porri]TGO91326.1 hypothetical protein BPOR_0031g00150 [Botrytis porri]